jgi:hypothetical protein
LRSAGQHEREEHDTKEAEKRVQRKPREGPKAKDPAVRKVISEVVEQQTKLVKGLWSLWRKGDFPEGVGPRLTQLERQIDRLEQLIGSSRSLD